MPIHGPMQRKFRMMILSTLLHKIREQAGPLGADEETDRALMYLSIAELVSKADRATLPADEEGIEFPDDMKDST